MPADTDPATARIHDDLVIGVECDNGARPIAVNPKRRIRRIPGKVVRPCLLPGVKEGHQVAGQRVGAPDGWSFEFITSSAGKTQVMQRGLTALGFGDE